jgi:hypothetical protein
VEKEFIIEIYWEPTVPESGVWDRSITYPNYYTSDEADDIVTKWGGIVAYRKREVE